jgi:DNA modification methylase
MSRQLIIHGDCTQVVPPDALGAFDVVITDPPYSPHVHSSAVSWSSKRCTRKRDFGFDPLSDTLRVYVAQAAARVKRWSVVYSDIESTHHLRVLATDLGATYIRTLAWIRWSMPQLSGDRPPQGREDLLIFHGDNGAEDLIIFYGAQKGRKSWNGPGNLTHLAHKCLRGEGKHRAEKPLDQVLDLVEWFSDPGDTVYDPFLGSGTTALACKILGRDFVGVEQDEAWANKAKARLDAPLSDRDRERLARWEVSKK